MTDKEREEWYQRHLQYERNFYAPREDGSSIFFGLGDAKLKEEGEKIISYPPVDQNKPIFAAVRTILALFIAPWLYDPRGY